MLKELFKDKRFLMLFISLLCVVPFEILSLNNIHLAYPIELVFFASVCVFFGRKVFKKGFKNLIKFNFASINLLMTIAVIGAFFIGQFEEAAIIIILFSVGEVLEDFGISRSKQALESLVSKMPKQVTLLSGEKLPLEVVSIGTIIRVRNGEEIALDGVIVAGSSLIQEATITGESLPKTKTIDDQVFAGTTVVDSYIDLRVTRLAKDTTLQKIINLTFEAASRKSETQEFIETFSKYYTPTILIIAAGLVVIPVFIFGEPFAKWFTEALTLLIISCPCALVISIPVSIFSAVGSASKRGVVIKGGHYLEAMGVMRALALDKTGTLTKAEPRVVDVIPFGKNTESEVVTCLAGLEVFSEHPLSKSIVAYAKEHKLEPHTYQNFQAVGGKGAKGVCLVCTDSHRCVGSLSFIKEEHGLLKEEVLQVVKKMEAEGKTTIIVSSDNEVKGVIGVEDTVREGAREAVNELKQLGITLIILTGDTSPAANHVARSVGIEEVYASLLPEDKAKKIELMTRKYANVGMIGDGVNDAPALALASVGIAMGAQGSDVAIENSDIALMNNNLSLVPYLVKLGRKVKITIRFNTFLAISVKLVFIILALIGTANLVMAIFADVGVTLLVVLNALRLYEGDGESIKNQPKINKIACDRCE